MPETMQKQVRRQSLGPPGAVLRGLWRLNRSEDSLWALLGQSWEAFGDSLGGPVVSWEVKVGSRRGLGGHLGVSWAVLGGSWEALGRAWEDLGGDKGKSPKNE